MSAVNLKPQFLIAAPASGSGKTTITLGLLRALARRGLQAQPFKCGPDYLDPVHHQIAAGQVSINLDTFMASPGHVRQLYSRYSAAADVAVTEAVMGLFDGADKMQGSSAEIAALLNLPVILVVDAQAMAYSAAALIYGFKNFYSGIQLKGVIFNHVNTGAHYRFLEDACQDAGVEALGYLPYQADLHIPSRHLGLSIAADPDLDARCDRIAAALSQTVQIDRLLEISLSPLAEEKASPAPARPTPTRPRIAVARDEAFSFTYAENLEVLSHLGEVFFFSPLHDPVLPPCDLLYLAGGYPELFLAQLSQNRQMRTSIRTYCENGGKTYAECGGMMYLGQAIRDQQGQHYEMVNFLDLTTSMEKPEIHLGYRIVTMGDLCIKGHEFHFSSCQPQLGAGTLNCRITNARGMDVPARIFQKQQTLASYLHLYWGEQPDFIQGLIKDTLPGNSPQENN